MKERLSAHYKELLAIGLLTLMMTSCVLNTPGRVKIGDYYVDGVTTESGIYYFNEPTEEIMAHETCHDILRRTKGNKDFGSYYTKNACQEEIRCTDPEDLPTPPTDLAHPACTGSWYIADAQPESPPIVAHVPPQEPE